MKSLFSTIKTINISEIAPYALVAISLFGLFFFQMTSTLLVSLYSGMNFIRDAISILVYLPYGWMQTMAFYVFGISILSMAAILYFKIRVKLNIGAILFAIIGLCLFIVGSFPTKLPGAPSTLTSIIHGSAATVVGIMFPLACFFIAHRLKTYKFRYLYIYTIVAGIFQVLFIIFGTLFLHGMTGIYERVLLWNGQIWIIVICINYLLLEMKGRSPANSWKRLTAQLSVAGALYVYGAILLPLCLPLIKQVIF